MVEAIVVTLAVAVAAVAIWLAVRVINRRERWAKLTLVAFSVLPVLYCLSLEPARELVFRFGEPEWMTSAAAYFYAPLFSAIRCGPDWLRACNADYCLWWGHRPGPPF